MNFLAGFADISLLQLLLVASVALFASIIGGLAGYGTGALMPLVLVPMVGAEPVVPIIAISAILTNLSRVVAYISHADRTRAGIVIAAAAVTTALGAYGYTRLTNAGAAFVIGTMLIMSVPLRRILRKREVRIGNGGLAAGAVGYGVLVGGTSGSGVILLSLLMAAGLEGAAVIATDAMISVATGVIKISVFGLAGVVTAQMLFFGQKGFRVIAHD
ncbi:TSUP family transporter, partial [Bradyrhizobium sp.]|uniref:TSUP family transporter n=1 Tax=Bradyrhizobium sp. TaxID=376 RepID=UPI00391C865D